jgi:hypothetical protein
MLVMKGKPAARSLAKVAEDALHELEDDLKTIQPGIKHNAELIVQSQKELVKFLKDVNMHVPNGWEAVVSSKTRTRKRKVVKRMQRR